MQALSRKNLGWILEFLTLMAVIIGLTFAALELRHLREAQEAQTVLALFEPLRSKDHIDATNMILALPDGLSASELQERLSAEESIYCVTIVTGQSTEVGS